MLSPCAGAQGKLREASVRPPCETLRCAQGDTRGPWNETLRCAQGDTRGQGDTVWQLWLMLISAMY